MMKGGERVQVSGFRMGFGPGAEFSAALSIGGFLLI
jgi:hypothetical protein